MYTNVVYVVLLKNAEKIVSKLVVKVGNSPSSFSASHSLPTLRHLGDSIVVLYSTCSACKGDTDSH